MTRNTDSHNPVAAANWQAYQRGRDNGHDDYVQSAKKQSKFYVGEQWDEQVKGQLDKEGRPTLTINLVMKVVNAFLGRLASNETNFDFSARRDTDEDTAEALTTLVRQILRSNRYSDIERDVFLSGLVSDRGYFRVRMDFSDNIMGDLSITDHDEVEVIPDSDAKSYDPKDWNSVIFTSWMTLDDVEAHYGKDKRDQVRTAAQSFASFGEDSIRYEGSRTFGRDQFDPGSQFQTYDDLEQRDIRAVRIIEREYRKLNRQRYFVDNEVGDMKLVPHDLSDDRAKEIAASTGVSIITRIEPQIRWVVTADNVVLHDDWSPYRSFTVIPFFPYFYKGKASGIVRQLLSPQEQFNKIESQMLHVINTMANSGWAVEAGSLVNMDVQELEERGAETGLVLQYAHGRSAPEKIEPNQVPTGLDRLAERSRSNLGDISGTQGVMADQNADVAGIALDKRESASLVQMQVPFDSLKRTRTLLANKVVELIQDFYTETRILRVTLGKGLERMEQEVVINGFNSAGQIVNDMTLGEYDVTISQRPSHDSFEDAQFATAMQMREVGIAIPDDEVIRTSPLDEKQRIADRVANLQGTAPPTPEEAQMAMQMQELEIRAAVAELAKLEAEVQTLQAKATETYAKAATLEGQAQMDAILQGAEFQRKMKESQDKIQMFYDNLGNKVELARIHSQANLQETLFTEGTRAASKELELRLRPNPTSNGSR